MIEIEPGFGDGEGRAKVGEAVGHGRSVRGDGRPAALERGPVLTQAGAAGHEPSVADTAGPADLLERLWLEPTGLEPGFAAVERDLALSAAARVDLLGRDREGRPVLVLVGDGLLVTAIGRAAGVLAAFHQVATVLDHFLASSGLDVTRAPRLVLLAPRFDEPRALGLDAVLSALGAELREADLVRLPGGGDVLHLADPRRESGPEAPVAAPAPAPAREPASLPSDPFTLGAADQSPAQPPDEDDDPAAAEARAREALPNQVGASAEARRLYQAASESIRSLSSGVASEVEGEGLVCRVEGECLATLLPGTEQLDVLVGHDGEPRFVVRDDAGLNASLNAVFSHYFKHFSSRD